MAETYKFDVEILHLLVSPAPAYFGRARDGAADVPTWSALFRWILRRQWGAVGAAAEPVAVSPGAATAVWKR